MSDLMDVAHRFYPTTVSTVSSDAQGAQGAGTVMVTSDPDGAEIYVNGNFVGKAPATLRLPAGPHSIQLKCVGCANWERSIDVLKDSQLTMKAQLQAK